MTNYLVLNYSNMGDFDAFPSILSDGFSCMCLLYISMVELEPPRALDIFYCFLYRFGVS